MTAPKPNDVKLSLRVPTDLLERADRLAKREAKDSEGEAVPVSSILRRAIRRGLDELEAEHRSR